MLDILKKLSQSEVRQISKGSLFLKNMFCHISKPIAQNKTFIHRYFKKKTVWTVISCNKLFEDVKNSIKRHFYRISCL